MSYFLESAARRWVENVRETVVVTKVLGPKNGRPYSYEGTSQLRFMAAMSISIRPLLSNVHRRQPRSNICNGCGSAGYEWEADRW